MHDAFQPLVARVKPLGNPARKYLRTIERSGESFLSRLEAAGALSHIHLDRTSPGIAADFRRVAQVGRDAEEQLQLLGTFYAVQFLHQNARTLEQLAVDLAERSGRLRSYAAFLERTEEQFLQLVSTYLGHVLRLVTPPSAGPFAVLSVGTPGHQDDIDTAIIHADGNRAEIDRAVARLAGQCQRYASPIDNYFASEVGASGFCLSLDELRHALGSGGLSFVVVTELLRAERIAGDAEILDRLRGEVTAEYFFRAGHDNLRHELFLRGLLGEIRSLLLRPPPPDQVNPKDDALRLIMGLATAFRTLDGVVATQPGAILWEVMAARPQLRGPLSRLEESRVFLETFRQVVQLLVTQDEEISVAGEAARENLARIAAAMGYRDRGPVHAVEHLLVHYHEAVEDAHAAADPLMEAVAQHLTQRSPFARWARGKPPEDLARKLATMLEAATRALRGVRFYDDLLEAFSAPEGHAVAAFIASFNRLPSQERNELAQSFAAWGREAPYAFLTLLTLVSAHERRGSTDPSIEIADAFLGQLFEAPEAVRALSRVFRYYPALVNRFLFMLHAERLERLDAALDIGIGNPEVATLRDGLRALIEVHRRSSRYIKRVLSRVTERHPATVEAISDDASLRTLALGRLAASERHHSPETQKELLGDYYDIEFLRIAMGTLRGESNERTRAVFGELTTTYLSRLFDFCFRQVEQETGGWTSERDRIGIFLSGGNARGRPYDEDYDLLAVLDSDDPATRLFAERVVVLMNGQIARRGVIPQYRLAEWLGRYVTGLEELAELLDREEDDLFVDRCQLLGSRMIVGSRRIAAQMMDQILRPRVFARATPFIRQVVREVTERRRATRTIAATSLHLKEDPGGLREIDLALAASKARLGVWDTPGVDPFLELARLDPPREAVYRRLTTINDFIVALRSAYRVAVSATATIEREHLVAPARIVGYRDQDGIAATDRLFGDLERRLAESAELVDQLLAAPDERS